MSDSRLVARGLGKRYRTGLGPRAGREFWALRDVGFAVGPGEAVGVLGRNGAGKSTLLKLLARISSPSEGEFETWGRVCGLLEVGTGFHPELTGRENVFLNGAILGMPRAEIERKFDEIVAFSEVEKFIDTPIKHFSSGMTMRLAFAVAAHLETDVLLVDEVLAVGDAAFQKKCLGKMREVGRQGRTVLFVSHDMAAVSGLTRRCLWLEGGALTDEGETGRVVGAYLARMAHRAREAGVESLPRVTGGRRLRLTALELLDDAGRPAGALQYGQPLTLRFEARVLDPTLRYFAVEWTIATPSGERALYASSSPQGTLLIEPEGPSARVECRIESLPLAAGPYFVNVLLSIPHQERLDEVEAAASFEVATCDPYGTGFNVDRRVAIATLPTRWALLGGARSHLDAPEPGGVPR